MKFHFQNYEIDFLYDQSYNNIVLNIENIETHRFYVKEITIDTFNKLQFEKHSNISNVKSGIHFFEKVFNNQSGYTLTILENENLLSNFKKIHILTLEFKGVLEEYFEIYCKFDVEEKVFSMEEKVMRMMEKMKGSYEFKINHIESQLNNLQNMILNISNLIGMPQKNVFENNISKVPSSNNMSKVPSSNNISKVPSSNNISKVPSSNNISKVPSTNDILSLNTVGNILRNSNIVFRDSKIIKEEEPFVGLIYEENEVKEEKEIKKNIVIQKSKKNIKELSENETNFYDTFYNAFEEDKEFIPKKMFVTHYQALIQNSTIPNVMNKWYNFINNSDEHIILNIEKDYANIFVSNHGKVFIFHCYGGLVNEISLQHYAEISGFQNSVSIKDAVEKIKVLFENIVHIHSFTGDSRVALLNFFKKFELFIENII
jgi:hypothetical protein